MSQANVQGLLAPESIGCLKCGNMNIIVGKVIAYSETVETGLYAGTGKVATRTTYTFLCTRCALEPR